MLDKFYKLIFNFSSTSHLNDISTPSFELDYFRTVHSYVRQHKRNMPAYINPIYPGQRIMLPLYAKDKNRHNVVDYAIVTFSTGIHTKMSKRPTKLAWKVLPDDINQVLFEERLCTIVYVTMLNYNISFNPTNATLILSSHYYSTVLTIKLDKLSNCPIGFELNITEGKCVCSNLLYKFNIASDDCQISPKVNYSIPIIKRPNLIWLGLMKLPNGITVLGAAGTCYYYCKKDKKYTVFVVNSTSVTIANPNNPSNSISLCLDNREGPLCSQCSPGYSVVFGSNECKQCSNWWLLILIVYAVTGPLFICLLYALRLTLTTGTLNGIIFCAQMLQVSEPLSSNYNYLGTINNIFLSFKLAYPQCLYNGLTEVQKFGMNMIYPVYLLLLLVMFVVLSRYSVKLSNMISGSSTQVLVTVVHLSFSKLLISLMNVFTSIHIHTNTSEVCHVWFRDATLEYGTGSHLVLMIITLVIVGPILGVYLTVLLAGRPLMRINYRIREYLRPVYEAIHAPYKRNKELFFVARLVIVLLLYTLYDIYRGYDILVGFAIASPILTTYTALEGLCRPFKRMSINLFNFILLSLSSLAYGSGWYFLKDYENQGIIAIFSILNTVMTISLIGIIILHLLWVTGILDKLNNKRWNCCHRPMLYQPEEASHVDLSGSFFKTYDRVREPLLSCP